MATAKKAAPKAAATPVKQSTVKAPGKSSAKAAIPAAKPVVAKKAPVSKTANAIAKINANLVKLNDRKAKLVAEINALKEQRAQLKAAPAPVAAPAAAPAKAAKAAPKAAKKK